MRIDEIESRHLVALLVHWITVNADWLQTDGLCLQKRLLEDGKLPVNYLALRARREELADIPTGREPQVKALLVKLGWNTSGSQQRLAQDLAGRLNLVKWHPKEAQTVLLERITGLVQHPQRWLDGHIAWALAEQLAQDTPSAGTERVRGRL